MTSAHVQGMRGKTGFGFARRTPEIPHAPAPHPRAVRRTLETRVMISLRLVPRRRASLTRTWTRRDAARASTQYSAWRAHWRNFKLFGPVRARRGGQQAGERAGPGARRGCGRSRSTQPPPRELCVRGPRVVTSSAAPPRRGSSCSSIACCSTPLHAPNRRRCSGRRLSRRY